MSELGARTTLNLALITLCSRFASVVDARGTGIVSASGGSADGVCVDCGSADKDGEMECALIILTIILCMFFVILACQCVHRCLVEVNRKKNLDMSPDTVKAKGMPPPPYTRQCYNA